LHRGVQSLTAPTRPNQRRSAGKADAKDLIDLKHLAMNSGEISDGEIEVVEYPFAPPGKPLKRICVPRGPDNISVLVKTARPWEYILLTNLYKRASRGGSYVEVGANIGSDTVLATDYFKMCYAFEPGARHIAMFNKTMELNGITNVRLFGCAVSNQTGPARLYFGEKTNTGSATLVSDHPDTDRFEQVQTVTLDGAMPPEVCDVTYVQIDAEGHDVLVLQGARHFIARQQQRPVIRLEFQPRALKAHGSSVAELFAFMREFRYSVAMELATLPLNLTVLSNLFDLWQNTSGWIDIFLLPP